MEDLERNVAAVAFVAGEVHGGHAASPELSLDPVAGQQSRRERRRDVVHARILLPGLARTLSDRPTDRRRWNGRRLPGRGHETRPPGGAEGPHLPGQTERAGPLGILARAERRQRFEREARAVAALNHPNIITIYSVEEHEAVLFLTMEQVEGRTLTDLIPREGMSLAQWLQIAIPLADAVGAAHQRGITHRDLKAANVMVGTRRPPEGPRLRPRQGTRRVAASTACRGR